MSDFQNKNENSEKNEAYFFERTIDSEYPFKGKLINLRRDTVELSNGAVAGREIVEHSGGVCVGALNDKNEFLFVKQFRYPFKQVILELPAGKIDRGEDPLTCGIRELREETGAVAEKFISLGEMYPTTGYCDEIIHIYYAEGLTYGESDPDEDEFLEVLKIDFDKAVEMVLTNDIKDAKTQTAIMKVALMKASGLL